VFVRSLVLLLLMISGSSAHGFFYKHYAFRCLSVSDDNSPFINYSREVTLDDGTLLQVANEKIAFTYFNDRQRTTIAGSPQKAAEKHCENWAKGLGIEDRYKVHFCRHSGSLYPACQSLWNDVPNLFIEKYNGDLNRVHLFSSPEFSELEDIKGRGSLTYAFNDNAQLSPFEQRKMAYLSGLEQPQVGEYLGKKFCSLLSLQIGFHASQTGTMVEVLDMKSKMGHRFSYLGPHPEFQDGAIYQALDPSSPYRFYMSNYPRSLSFGPHIQAFSNSLRRIKRFKLKDELGDLVISLEWAPWRVQDCR